MNHEDPDPASADELVYKAYAQHVESDVVLMLVASCSYLIDSGRPYLQSDEEPVCDEEQHPQKYYFYSVTYDIARTATRRSSASTPATLTVRDGSGTHDVAVEQLNG